MSRRAGPWKFLRSRDNSRPDRIELDVTDRIDEVVRVERRREVTPLPKVATLIPHAIDALGVLPMNGFQGAVQIVHSFRDQDQVNVVGHQTVGDDLDAKALDMPAQQFQVSDLIAITEEHIRTVITALGDVVRDPGENEA